MRALQRLEADAAPDERDGRHPAGGDRGRGGGHGGAAVAVAGGLLTAGSYPPAVAGAGRRSRIPGSAGVGQLTAGRTRGIAT